MSKGIFVTATGTDAGKTYIAALMTKLLRKNGINAGYYKAALSGAELKDGILVPGDCKFVADMAGISMDFNDYLKNSSRSFIFSTALAPATVAAAIGGIEYILDHPEDVQKLRENVRYFVGKLNDCGMKAAGETAIIPIIIGDENKAQEISARLFDMNIFIPCIRYPTVKKGEARLRVTLMATHTHSDIDYAVDCLKNIIKIN